MHEKLGLHVHYAESFGWVDGRVEREHDLFHTEERKHIDIDIGAVEAHCDAFYQVVADVPDNVLLLVVLKKLPGIGIILFEVVQKRWVHVRERFLHLHRGIHRFFYRVFGQLFQFLHFAFLFLDLLLDDERENCLFVGVMLINSALRNPQVTGNVVHCDASYAVAPEKVQCRFYNSLFHSDKFEIFE